jgi:hypothetical protein
MEVNTIFYLITAVVSFIGGWVFCYLAFKRSIKDNPKGVIFKVDELNNMYRLDLDE